MFGFFKNVFRFRLYFVQDGIRRYVLKGQSPIRLLGYVSNYYENKRTPSPGWKCYFYSDATKKSFELTPLHFNDPVNILSNSLFSELDLVDSRWSGLKGSEIKFEDLERNVELEIDSKIDVDAMFAEIKDGTARKVTFFSVMDSIFSRR